MWTVAAAEAEVAAGLVDEVERGGEEQGVDGGVGQEARDEGAGGEGYFGGLAGEKD